jgi:hypothetical protein
MSKILTKAANKKNKFENQLHFQRIKNIVAKKKKLNEYEDESSDNEELIKPIDLNIDKV